MAVTIDAGERTYELVEGWGDLRPGWVWGVTGAVAVDSKDRVHVFTRTEYPYMVFNKAGRLLDVWGRGIFEDAHGLCIGPDDSVYLIDRDPNLVTKFSKAGKHLLSLGTRGVASNTGWTNESRVVTRAGGPFNYPTDVGLSPNGDIYVSDGYRNCRVHKYSPDGQLLFSWGTPGSGPGEFNLVHSVWEHKEKVYVADRVNGRIQIFTPFGDYLGEWGGFKEPCKIFIDKNDVIYVAELGARVSILDLQGNVLARWGGERSHAPGYFYGPHGIWTDSEDSLYVAEVLEGARVQKFARKK